MIIDTFFTNSGSYSEIYLDSNLYGIEHIICGDFLISGKDCWKICEIKRVHDSNYSPVALVRSIYVVYSGKIIE